MDTKPIRQDTVPSMLNRLQAQDSKDKKLKKACSDFEALMLDNMLKSMRKTIPQDNRGVDGNQKEIFQSMLDHELATQVSQSKKSLGIGDALYQNLTRDKISPIK
ncbi:MAG: rod-binding protein [Proteobacteria bacterium]|nr:rod-binding protein [Pseudomonadota bacterium]